MGLFSSTQPSLRARVIPRFPAQVIAGQGMTITKAGGVYTFAMTTVIDTISKLPNMNTDRLLGRDAAGIGPPEELTVSTGIGFNAAGGIELTQNQRIRTLPVRIGYSASAIAAGVSGDVQIPFACNIYAVTLLADQSGSIVLDIWKDTYTNYPPTADDSICAAAKPTLLSAIKYTDATLTGWTVGIAAGDVLRVNVDSASTVTRVSLNLHVLVT